MGFAGVSCFFHPPTHECEPPSNQSLQRLHLQADHFHEWNAGGGCAHISCMHIYFTLRGNGGDAAFSAAQRMRLLCCSCSISEELAFAGTSLERKPAECEVGSLLDEGAAQLAITGPPHKLTDASRQPRGKSIAVSAIAPMNIPRKNASSIQRIYPAECGHQLNKATSFIGGPSANHRSMLLIGGTASSGRTDRAPSSHI